MRVVFRVDASLDMGSGHTMRCLTLAHALKARGHECEFVVREQPGHLIALIRDNGYIVHILQLLKAPTTRPHEYTHSDWLLGGQEQDSEDTLAVLGPQTCDWLVVDHYGIGAPWEAKVRNGCNQILVVDDLADRAHDCDILLDQNMGRRSSDYEELLPKNCVRLIGPQYALLRPEFAAWREKSLSRRRQGDKLREILISLGGVDKDNVTGSVLRELETSSLSDSATLTVVLGQQNPWLKNIQQQAVLSRFDVTVRQGVSNMAELMSRADAAIGAAGSTSWERCCLGLPTIMLVLAENQKHIASSLHKAGASVSVEVVNLVPAIERLMEKQAELGLISVRASAICEGAGTMQLIEILEQYNAC